ncbi:hypothetical protein CAEBREN_02529 [Caenorhabditis brenneri]|uniref:Uncharacterized protein n=1 Tax=Caenorhabditis brenneri TaxID=135651 RepID=G0MLC7_CAEBE|nr:hypothetical protein CAEBREN_02529 [Caenorhabditis brenneri]
MLRSERPLAPQINRGDVSEDERDFRTVGGIQDKMHEIRMMKIRENLEDVRKKNWIHVGNAFREQPLAPSKP